MYNSINICKILHIFCVSDKLANEEDIYIYIYISIYRQLLDVVEEKERET